LQTAKNLTSSQSSLYSVHFLRYIPYFQWGAYYPTIKKSIMRNLDHRDEYTEYFIAMMKHQAFYSFPNDSFQINVSSPSHFCVYTTLFLIFVLFTIRVTLFFFHIHVLCTKKKQDAKKFWCKTWILSNVLNFVSKDACLWYYMY